MKGISAYILDDESRTELTLWHFPPRFEKFIGHHVTVKFKASDKDPLPTGTKFEVVGYAQADDGLEALVVAVDGNIQREDGEIYHITWSLNPGIYSPKDSKALIKNGYTDLGNESIEIKMKPVFLPFN